MTNKKFRQIGQRFEMYILTQWIGGECNLCQYIGIDENELAKYYSGEKNILDYGVQLAEIGIDLNAIATGEIFIGAKRHIECKKCSEGIKRYKNSVGWYDVIIN